MNRAVKFALLVAVGVLYSAPLSAHHGAAAFDTSKKLVLSGTVTQWFWANPHCFLKVDVKGENGEVAHWIAETSNPADMINVGWSKETLKPGEEVTVTVEPVKNGRPAGRVLEVILPNGKTLYATGKAPGAAAGATGNN
jgi:uncharacterized protein DUF6152